MPVKAGDGNRTHMASLEGWNFAIKLHPQLLILHILTNPIEEYLKFNTTLTTTKYGS